MGVRKYLGKVLIRTGLLIDAKSGDSFEYLTDAMKKEADCGCGVDCCEKAIVLTDRTSGEHVEIYLEGGSIKFKNRTTAVVKTVTAV